MKPEIFKAVADALLDCGLGDREALRLLLSIRRRLDQLQIKEKITRLEQNRPLPSHD